ncbi:MAG: GH36-type glycosyl hydrolase domain-containing protein, partial [Burkholderiales bacterium]
YKVEPYVMAADVYALAPHVGRGGWTWYTGSAGWMLRLYVESLLGFSRTGNLLRFAPCWHPGWSEFTLRYRFHETMYRIVVRPGSAAVVMVDGIAQPGSAVTLVDDRREHAVEVSIVAGTASATAFTPG